MNSATSRVPQASPSPYDNRARVPEAPALLSRWAEASALARAQSTCELDVPYGDGPNETLDVFPAASPDAPVMVFFHGGYWRTLDKSDVSFVAPGFVARDVTVVVPNYALCPAVTIETICRQAAAATAWALRRRVGGTAPSRVVVAGHSAGGHLAAMLMACRWKMLGDDLPPSPLAGGLGLSGLYDLEPLRHEPFLQADLQLTEAQVRRCSPAFFPRSRSRFYAVVGLDESEAFIRQSRLLRDNWGPTSVPVCETVPGMNHFTLLHSLADPAGRVHDLALRLLGRA
jgi:arylformamidase